MASVVTMHVTWTARPVVQALMGNQVTLEGFNLFNWDSANGAYPATGAEAYWISVGYNFPET